MSIWFRKPNNQLIESAVESQRLTDFTYSMQRCTFAEDANEKSIEGYVKDHNRVRLGEGSRCFQVSIEALKSWEMFNLGWVQVADSSAPIETGTVACVIARVTGFWALNLCRIVYVVDEQRDHLFRYGFGYGTLPDHAFRGEERFCIEWNREDDSVWYDVLAFSSPRSLIARVAYPVARTLQRRFATCTKEAMLRACNAK